MEPQSIPVKRAQVEFHSFASLGEPERVLAIYAEENRRRGGLIRKHLGFIGGLTPFVEIGANAGHTSYLLANEFGAEGFALDLSADALRYGVVLQERWGLERAPVRVAGDAERLPFRDGSMRFAMACQMLYQFMDIERIFVEVKRILAPGGVFLFTEEPLKRLLSLRLYRCPYWESMKPWERKLFEWGLLGYLVRDVIGARQEESFGIRLNHKMGLKDWRRLAEKHFVAQEYEIFVPERGWGESAVKRMAVRLDRYRSVWRAAQLLGGTVTAVCRKGGSPSECPRFEMDRFEAVLRCPDCGGDLGRGADEALRCARCGYWAAKEEGVYNLLPAAERKQLYPGEREDTLDVSRAGHERHLGEGWHEVEGVFGNKYRWIGGRATARLKRVQAGPLRLRVRGNAPEAAFAHGAVRIRVAVNGAPTGEMGLHRTGLFVFEADVPEAAEYLVEIQAQPVWRAPGDERDLTVTLSMIRLVLREGA
ncbi:MAG: class I SAM-dependent methyltransferase [Bryobacteraceae bacterium]|jgi:SAM-dependent methyltransferase